MLLPGAGLDRTRDMAERLRAAIDAEPTEGVDVTASFGVAVSGPAGLDFDDLFEQADEVLYRAKAEGRNCVRAVEETAVAEVT